MTLTKNAAGIYEGDFRVKDIPRLHLSMSTRKKGEGQERHDAVMVLFRQRRVAMIEQLRAGVLTVERVTAMVKHGEPLAPIEVETKTPVTSSTWGTVEEEGDRYLDWIDANPRKSEGTHETVTPQIRRFCRFEYGGVRVGDMRLDEVRSDVVLAYQRELLAQAKPNTVTNYVGRVRALYRWAQKQEERRAREERRAPHALYSPVDTEMLSRETTSRDRWLTQDDAERLFAATPEPLLFPVAAGLFAGLRLGEVLNLRPELDIDLELGTLAIQKQQHWAPKTKRSARVVPLAAPLRPILERHLLRYASEAWVVPSLTDPKLPFNERTFQNHFTAIVKRAELVTGRADPNGVTFHTLRHTFGSWLAQNGVDLYTIAKLMGDTLAVVEATYAHLSPDVKRAAVAKLAGLVSLPTFDENAE